MREYPFSNHPTFSFDPEFHIYRLGEEILPSVSEILKPANAFYKPGSAEFGKTVHSATAEIDLLDSPIDSFSKALRPRLEAWKNFLEGNIKIKSVEIKFFSAKYKFAGTCDRLIVLHRLFAGFPEIYCTVDLKTGAKVKWHRWQVAGYAVALQEFLGITIKGGIVVYLLPTGGYKIDSWYDEDFEILKQEFLDKLKEYKERKNG